MKMKILIVIAFGSLFFAQNVFADNSEPAAADASAFEETSATELNLTSNENLTGLTSELHQLKAEKKVVSSDSTTSTSQMFMGLLAVLGLIVLLAWAAKRMNLQGMSVGNDLKLQSILSLGPKEKVAVVEIDGKRMLLGVTPHNINMLCELDEQQQAAAAIDGNTPEPLSFAQQIKKALKQGNIGENSGTS